MRNAQAQRDYFFELKAATLKVEKLSQVMQLYRDGLTDPRRNREILEVLHAKITAEKELNRLLLASPWQPNKCKCSLLPYNALLRTIHFKPKPQ